MKFLKKVLFILVLPIWTTSIRAQMKWGIVNDTITLTPNRFAGKGAIDIKNGNLIPMHVDGTIAIDLKENNIYFNDGKNLFQFESKQLASIKLDNYGSFLEEDLFRRNFSDSLLQHYRRLIYPNLNLNEIVFSLSKRLQYEVKDNALILKNQKRLKGKICYVDLNNIIIINENGGLEKLKDGDFNFLEVGEFKTFTCIDLYNYLFSNFEQKLRENINKWEDDIMKDNIEILVSVFGPFDNIINISTDKKMIIWKRVRPAYYLNLSSNARLFSFTSNSYLSNIISNSSSFLYKISPLFIYGNSYRNTDISLSGSNINNTATQTNQSGSIIYRDEGSTFGVIQDLSNKIVQVYHENIFSEPQYGKSFKFINF